MLVLEPPELSPPPEVEEGVASGSLPVALARVALNPLSYSQSIRHVEGQLVKCVYSIIQVRPMWD